MSLADDVHALALRQAKAFAFVRGVLVVGAILLASVQWYALRQLDYLVQQGRQVAEHSQRLAVLENELTARCVRSPPPDDKEKP